MSSQPSGRGSGNTRSGPSNYSARDEPRQDQMDPHNQNSPGMGLRSDGGSVQNPRFQGLATDNANRSNTSLSASPVNGRGGQDQNNSRDLTIRANQRPTVGPGNSGGEQIKTPAQRICKKCGESLSGQFVRALNGTFHLECFKCQVRLKQTLGSS